MQQALNFEEPIRNQRDDAAEMFMNQDFEDSFSFEKWFAQLQDEEHEQVYTEIFQHALEIEEREYEADAKMNHYQY